MFVDSLSSGSRRYLHFSTLDGRVPTLKHRICATLALREETRVKLRRRLGRQVRYSSPRWALGFLVLLLVVGVLVRTHSRSGGEPQTAGELRKVATTFHRDFSLDRPRAMYPYFDSATRRVVSESKYAHLLGVCPGVSGTATITSVQRGSNGWWRVYYQIHHVSYVEYWRYETGRFVFDLPRSHPSAVKLYHLSLPRYATALGCRP